MRGSLFTIGPDVPFLPTLVARVLDGTLLRGAPQTGPFWLSDVTIIVPTQRSRRILAQEFAAALGGATLLPDIRSFAGEPADEEPFLPPFDGPGLPQPVGPLERTLRLSRLIAAWAKSERGQQVLATPPNAAEIFRLADSLGEVLDDLTTEGGSLRPLDDEIGKLDLAENWKQTREFLDIAQTYWQGALAEEGKADLAALRDARLRRQAAAVETIYGDRPVIAAGSTGSIKATAALLKAIGRLPRGSVVLPGLDTSIDGDAHARFLDPNQGLHGHSQYAMAQLLRGMGVTHGEVASLSGEPSPRVRLTRQALATAEETAAWASARAAMAPELDAALAGLIILAARNEEEEARAIAIVAREGVAAGKTVGIISPDQNLSRRIAAELQRFEVEVEDAAGVPLFQSAAGRLARQLLSLVMEDFGPVDLMALLQNRAVTLGLTRREVSHAARRIEMGALRGQYPRPGLAGLRRLIEDNVNKLTAHPARRLSWSDQQDIFGVLDRLEQALAPLVAATRGHLHARNLAAALATALTALTAPADGEAAPAVPGLTQLEIWAADMAAAPDEGPPFAPVALDAVLAALMAGRTVTNSAVVRDDIQIWGQLEARLMSPDRMILAGVNEEIWPRAADPGPWLSRSMRLAAGLEPPERQQGQAAHDFEMAIGRGDVIVAFAERRGTAPALPSRFLQRLEAFVGQDAGKALRTRGRRYLDAARKADAAGTPAPARRPVPKPPAVVRPRKLSVTEIERLFRSPYDIYARHVLDLRALDPLGQEPGGRERGSMVHDVFAKFIVDGLSLDASAQPRLEAMAREAFGGLDAIGERRDIWLRRFAVAAALFLEFEQGRDPSVAQRNAEILGEWPFPMGFTLTGRADRVDQLGDGSIEIIDFKTGSVPEPKEMKSFEAPQLLLEAAMMQAKGMGELPAATVSALTYIKIGSGAKAYRPRPFVPANDDLPGAIEEVVGRLQRHVDALLIKDNLPMAARIVPDAKQRFRGEFDHLARTDEWLVQEDPDY